MRNLRVEIPRKLFHLGATLLLLIPLYLFGRFGVAVVCGLLLIILVPVAYGGIRNRLTAPFWSAIDRLEREENMEILPGKQAFALAGGMLIASLLFDEGTLAVCITTTAVYDGFATIIGLKFGRHKLPTGKSVEGTLGGIVLNTVFLLPFTELGYAVLISLFAGFVENLASWKRWYLDDNFLLPLFVGAFVKLLNIPAKLPQLF